MPSDKLSLDEAIFQVLGHRVHESTARRWVRNGVGGHKLNADFLCGRYQTSVDSVREFLRCVSESRTKNGNK